MSQREKNYDTKELVNQLLKDIQQGVIQDAEGQLPTEPELMNQYHVTRYTLRQALKNLANLGYIYQAHGSGTFARPHHVEGAISLQNNVGLTEEMARQGKVVKTTHISQEVVPLAKADFIPENQKLDKATELISVIRQRKLDDEPFLVEHSYYLKSIVGEIPDRALKGSLFAFINQKPGLKVGFIDSVIECEMISGLPARFFNVPDGSPSLVVRDDSYLSSGKLFAFSKIFYDFRKTKFFMLKKMH
ncbi:GntR family transcriptional regulator [Lacticaseibacillus zeae]|uniref:GntR family transcriptional regulator n=2 Tax=Lacticaseibacillus TaxID=2759736 RepID=A0ABY9L4L0_9LACO|nr:MULTISPECIES: GntR family transcriptional regulator [Lacticaseibacillus]MDE3281507.1 GntR family transcriptional regulator [Lacticaseibacillus casei]TLF38859.1 GntR family transcriptional regulator [Lacticaseibacillus zeae]WLV78423.1 GntR family transcriptional regulator [Lacticaseibacillus sp. NCIMB 15471]